MGLFNLGVSKIEFSAIAADGDVGDDFETLGLTQEGTCKINFADATITELKVEEFASAADSDISEGEKTVEFTIANPDEDTFVALFGGIKSGTDRAVAFLAPLTSVNIEKSLKITPVKGLGFIFPRVLVTAKPTSDVGRGTWMGIAVTCRVLKPTKNDVPTWSTFRV